VARFLAGSIGTASRSTERSCSKPTDHARVTFAPDEVADVAELIAETVTVIYVQPA
jgi:hypothetical protein